MENQELQTQPKPVNLIENTINELINTKVIIDNITTKVKLRHSQGQKLLKAFSDSGGEMTAEFNERMNKYLIANNETFKEVEEERVLVTAPLDLLKKEILARPAAIDIKKQGTPAYICQQLMNSFAETIAKAEKERLLQIELQKKRDNAIIELRANIEREMYAHINNFTKAKKTDLSAWFKDISLITFDEKSQHILKFVFNYKITDFNTFKYSGNRYPELIDAETFGKILIELSEAIYPQEAAKYTIEMCELRDSLVMQLPAKKAELESVAAFQKEQELQRIENERIAKEQLTANAARQAELKEQQEANEKKQREAIAEQTRINNEKIERERKEVERLAFEQREKEKQQQIAIETKSESAKVVSMFNSASEESQVDLSKQMKEGYEIEVLGAAGLMALFQNWFEHNKFTLDLKKLPKWLDTIINFAEKQATKDDNLILPSTLLKYKPIYKAKIQK